MLSNILNDISPKRLLNINMILKPVERVFQKAMAFVTKTSVKCWKRLKPNFYKWKYCLRLPGLSCHTSSVIFSANSEVFAFSAMFRTVPADFNVDTSAKKWFSDEYFWTSLNQCWTVLASDKRLNIMFETLFIHTLFRATEISDLIQFWGRGIRTKK